MKVVVVMEYMEYLGGEFVGAVIVPDDFDEKVSIEQWREETFKPRKWKNQFREGVSKHSEQTIPFHEWLHEKYGEPQVILCDF